MIVPPSVQRKHDMMLPYVKEVSQRVRDLVSGFCEKEGYAFAGRAKEKESLAEKIETGRFSKWSELDDLYACCIIVPTLVSEAGVVDWLRQTFAVVDVRVRGATQKDPAVFRFDATRFIGALSKQSFPNAGENILAVRFEIQVRTAFEHAWSVTTHALAYKSVQIDWRNIRLAAQLKAAVEQLDQVILTFESSSSSIVEHSWPEVVARQRIERAFRLLLSNGSIPSEVQPMNWIRFSENLQRVILSRSERKVRGEALVSTVEAALRLLDAEIAVTDLASFPRSISLLQFCLGALAKQSYFSGPLHEYKPLVTTELVDLFPASKILGVGFDLELSLPNVAQG